MLVGICGAKCAGKNTVAQYLIDHHGFKKLHLQKQPPQDSHEDSNGPTPEVTEPETQANSSSGADLTAQPKPRPLSNGRGPSAAHHSFRDVAALLDFVTKQWRSRWVTTDIHTTAILDALSRRPFFILISVDAPVTVRWQRWQQRQQQRQRQQQPILHPADGGSSSSSSNEPRDAADEEEEDAIEGFEDFVAYSDAHLYDPARGVLPLLSRASIRLVNTGSDRAHLYATLSALQIADPERLRPGWDAYFMSLASLAARRSNCMKRAVGAVLVDGTRRVLATGYNGTPQKLANCADGGCARCNAGDARAGVALATCLCLHAEENALLMAGRERVAARDGALLYCDTCPCLTCAIKIVQAGIAEVVYSQGYSMDSDTARVLRSAGVRLRQFSPPANGLIHLEKMDFY
ncbi:cytidine deaminase-like protein [Xylariomycetidae sp. FL0641]|nr:cytidine deaminase-like protein [Xylariomycetidae sp. FL0641]